MAGMFYNEHNQFSDGWTWRNEIDCQTATVDFPPSDKNPITNYMTADLSTNYPMYDVLGDEACRRVAEGMYHWICEGGYLAGSQRCNSSIDGYTQFCLPRAV